MKTLVEKKRRLLESIREKNEEKEKSGRVRVLVAQFAGRGYRWFFFLPPSLAIFVRRLFSLVWDPRKSRGLWKPAGFQCELESRIASSTLIPSLQPEIHRRIATKKERGEAKKTNIFVLSFASLSSYKCVLRKFRKDGRKEARRLYTSVMGLSSSETGQIHREKKTISRSKRSQGILLVSLTWFCF